MNAHLWTLALVFAGEPADADASSPAPDAAGDLGIVTTYRGRQVAPPRFEPWFAVSSKMLFRTLTLEQGGEIQRERDTAWKPMGIWIGAQGYYRRGHSWATGGLRGDLALGLELMSYTASPAVGLSHTTGYEWHVRPRFNVFVGGRLTVAVDPLHLDQSHLELGVPLGASWRRVELQWIPSVSVPLSVDRRDVYDGELRRRMAVMYMPINFTLAFKLGRHREISSP